MVQSSRVSVLYCKRQLDKNFSDDSVYSQASVQMIILSRKMMDRCLSEWLVAR